MRHKLTLAYDGSLLYGWQKTDEGPSVESSLTAALEKILQKHVTLEAASRTDRGVHALGQVASFNTDEAISYPVFTKGVNSLLSPSIRLLKAESVSETFHPTLDSKTKEYHYFVSSGSFQLPHHRHYAWHVPYSLDLSSMRNAASSFIGEHDFAAFTNVKNNEKYDSTIRCLDLLTMEEQSDGRLQFRLIGNHFLYKMVRNLVGTLVMVGRGKISNHDVSSILLGKDRKKAGITAPAHGLWLHSVAYGT